MRGTGRPQQWLNSLPLRAANPEQGWFRSYRQGHDVGGDQHLRGRTDMEGPAMVTGRIDMLDQ